MASPFRIFRKYQKTLLVVAGVVLMFVFVVGDSLMSYISGSRAGRGAGSEARAVAVSWDGGRLTNEELYDLVVQRRILNEFLRQVEGSGARTAYEAGVEPRQLHVQRMLGPEKPQEGVEQHVVQIRLFADAARETGMRVSDETIVEYLDELGRGNVSRDDMRAILTRLQSGGWNISIDYVVDAGREEMLAHNYIASHQFAFETITPEQRWKDWLRVNDHIIIEAAGIPVESFVVDVKEPTDAELVEFFDKYKEREASPDLAYGTTELPSATPGFRIPRKIDLQFVQADFNEFRKKVEGEISEEEIAKYYEENKDPLFIKADTELIDEAAKEKEAEGATDAEKDAIAQPADEAKSEEAAEPGDEEKEKFDETEEPSLPDESGAATTEPVGSDESGAKEDQPPAEADEGQPQKDESDDAAPEGKQSSHDELRRSRVFHLVAFQENEASGETAADDNAADDTAADDTAAEDAADPAATPTDDSGEATESADADAGKGQPASDPEQPAPAASSDSTSTPAAAADPSAPATPPAAPPSAETSSAARAAKEKPVEFQPLDEVRDQIRRQLAEARVAEQLGKVADEVAGELRGEYEKYFSETLAEQPEQGKPPAPPKSLVDMAPRAAKYGLQHGQTGPMSVLELRETPVGKSGVAETGATLLQALFASSDLDLYQPIATVDVDGNRFIVMKMSDTPGGVPSLSQVQVRNEVVRAWKLQQAAELALKDAEDLAKKAQEAKSPLTDFFADNKAVTVVRTDPFSELTGGLGFVGGRLQPQPFRLGEPDGVAAAGPEFMRRVFKLKDGEVAATLNHDRTIAYVVRVVEHQPSLPELRTAYLGEANMWPGRQVMTASHAQEIRTALARDVVQGNDLKWERDPDKVEQEEVEE